MAWRDTLLRYFGPGLGGGLTFGKWLSLLWENRFAIPPSGWWRAGAITWQSLQNGQFALLDRWKIGSKVDDIVVPPPVFLLGHWRNGTTHLHNLMTVDARFAFPNNYQTLFPSSFLTAEALHSWFVDFLLPKRRPMDNVEWDMRSPQEDEFALALLSGKSPYLGWIFPRNRDYYDKFLTFREASAADIAAWRAAFELFAKKLTWKYKRPLVLKSPGHTCRIKLLLEIFPGAKFVHIHRNPFAVFPSWRKTLLANFEIQRVQRPRTDDLDDWIIRHYRVMHDIFFEERGLIPAGHFVDLAFEDLERDPVGEVRRIYEALALPEFAVFEPALRRYVDSIAGYKKNEFPALPAELRKRIRESWGRYFDEWGYSRE
jgi:hypothetical protein